ncbi:MAG: GntR family transcriptional regulator [Bacteroidota bacterium]
MKALATDILGDLQINSESRTPKYKQIINHILDQIEKENLMIGDRIPSINEMSEEYYLSRDTVEKAYSFLKERKIIASVKGKGYFISNVDLKSRINVCLIFNKLSTYKKIIFNNIIWTLGPEANVDLYVHHCDKDLFKNILKKNLGEYNYYVIMPHFQEVDDELVELIRSIPKDQLLVLDKDFEKIEGNHGAVYQNFQKDIYKALGEATDLLEKYHKLVLVFPIDESYPYPPEIVTGFVDFCRNHEVSYDIIDTFDPGRIIAQKGEAFILLTEYDLVNLVKSSRNMGWKIGHDVGIISYNETPLKEVLADGITVISTDFEKMGQSLAKMILEKKKERIENEFSLIRRNSL